MSVSLYDQALLNKLNRWVAGTHTTILGVDDTKRLFEITSDTKYDQPIKLPLICLSRPGGYSISSKYKQPRTYNGFLFRYTQQRGMRVNVVPIDISYQIDIYTRKLQEADEYSRNFIFNIINYPKLQVTLPYEDSNIVQDANIRLNSDVNDNSSIPERLIPGQFTRLTLGINLDDAYLFDVRVKDNLKLVEVSSQAEDTGEREMIITIN